MKTKTLLLAAAAVAACHLEAKPSFFLPETIYAAPGVECNVYFTDIFDSFTPNRYVFEALSEKGATQVERWFWTPAPEDAGKCVPLVIKAWSDDAAVATVTTRVQVARAPAPDAASRKVTFALLAASLTNSRYQDQIKKDMLDHGYPLFTPVGSNKPKDPLGAAHDGYGGFTFESFLTRYALSTDEIDNLQSEAERDQLRRFGEKIPAGQEWRRGLLKSPLVKLVNGEKVVDAHRWLAKVNEGKAPDIIAIELGVNGTFAQTESRLDAHIRDSQIVSAKKLVATLRSVAPDALIGICTEPLGCGQDGYGQNYGAKISIVQGRRNIFRLNRALKEWVESAGDPRMVLVPFSQAIDPVHGFIRVAVPAHARTATKITRDHNALHPSADGGKQLGDALYAWIANMLGDPAAKITVDGSVSP